jgi:hypothetical protein
MAASQKLKARSSKRKNRRAALVCEQSWVLTGQRRGPVWYARRSGRSVGQVASVEFDGLSVLDREERRHDVIGFFHTHPAMPATPSRRDVDTMRAWVGAFGKPLLCVIEGIDGVHGYRFDNDGSSGERLFIVEHFPLGVMIAVDADA